MNILTVSRIIFSRKFAPAIILFLTLINSINALHAQKVKIVSSSEQGNLPATDLFTFLEHSLDTGALVFVASIQAKDNDRKEIIESMYFAIREQATKLGANCFKLKSFIRDTLDSEAFLVLDCYVASDEVLNINRTLRENDAVFLFGEERKDSKSMKVNVNKEEKEIKAGTYLKYVLKENEELLLSKGGITGVSFLLKGEKESKSTFYSLSGFGLSELSRQPANGISFNTGRINQISNMSLGLLMVALLEQGN